MTGAEMFVDIHCHLLPGLDDGAATTQDALAMAGLAVEEGFSTVIATCHQLGNFQRNSSTSIRAVCGDFQQQLAAQGVALRVLPGADVRIEPDLVRRIADDEVLTLADGGRYVLLELPHEIYLPLDRLLEDLAASGLVGILSHPERNLGILRQPSIVERLVDAGCLMQVTAGSLTGNFGRQSCAMAEWMALQGLVHFVATDAHSPRTRRPMIRRAYHRVAQLAGQDAAALWCSQNPACVVAGRAVASGRGTRRCSGWTGWLRWRKAS